MRTIAAAALRAAKQATAEKAPATGKVVSIDRGRHQPDLRHIQLFMEDLRLRPRKPLKGESNAADIRRLTIQAIRNSKEHSLTISQVIEAIRYSLQFEIRGEFFLASILSHMKESRLAVMGGRIFLL